MIDLGVSKLFTEADMGLKADQYEKDLEACWGIGIDESGVTGLEMSDGLTAQDCLKHGLVPIAEARWTSSFVSDMVPRACCNLWDLRYDPERAAELLKSVPSDDTALRGFPWWQEPIGFIMHVDGRPIVPVYNWNDNDCWGVLRECRRRNVEEDRSEYKSWFRAMEEINSDHWFEFYNDPGDYGDDRATQERYNFEAADDELPPREPADGPCIVHGVISSGVLPGQEMDGYAYVIELVQD